MSLLRARSLCFSYSLETGAPLEILREFGLTLAEGEILCFLGPSGCGKSTLLKLLAGFLPPGSGEVLYKDRMVEAPFLQGQMIFQDPAQLLPWLTVRENILFPLKRSLIYGRKKKRDPRDPLLEDLLELTGLGRFADFYPVRLSGGMKQRCALARALYARPDILFMDEPFGSLDAPSRSSLQKLVLRLWEEKGVTVLFVTHDIPEALILADRLVLFKGPGGAPEVRDNPLARPRRRQDDVFLKEEARMFSYLESSGMTL